LIYATIDILSISTLALRVTRELRNEEKNQGITGRCYTLKSDGGATMAQLGIGMYTLADAARLIRADRRSISRWLYGYNYIGLKGEKQVRRHSDPLWSPQYDANDFGEKVIGFYDLLELRIVREFVRRGVPLLVIRHCLETAKEIFDTEYPFTKRRFVTDGETIFLEAMRVEAQDHEMLNLRTRQYTFREIIKASLYAGIEYDHGLARRWYPEHRSRAVVIDPTVEFGHPVMEESGIPTASLYATYLAENKNRTVVARLFEVVPRQVDAAVRFEEKLRQAA
jgi:uncharacterized protein (DUF433 family)